VKSRGARSRRRLRLMAAVLLLPLMRKVAAGTDPLALQRGRIEAAFLRNFARYVSWPAAAFANERTPWTVCVVGDGHFDDGLENTFEGRTEQGRRFEIVRAVATSELPSCQIVYIGLEAATQRRAALATYRRQPVLTVGNAAEFLQEGGIIRLLAGERIEMSINLDQARAVSIVIPAKLLELAREVLENGLMRRLR
jgi:hypothetical protein